MLKLYLLIFIYNKVSYENLKSLMSLALLTKHRNEFNILMYKTRFRCADIKKDSERTI